MSKFKIAVYAISKNEAQFVDRWVDSMCEADAIFVTDTGSQDDTVEKLKRRGVNVKCVNLSFWRFDTARNISLNFVPDDYDICVCTDLDEVFDKGWRKLIEEKWQKGITTRLKYMYTWSFNDDGTPGVTFKYEKIHNRRDFRWIHPVHEVLEYCGDNDVYAEETKIHLKHYPDKSKSRGQYLPLLELSVKESPEDDRNMHYLGREYMFYRMWDKCIETLKKHLNMKSSTWKDERCASMRFIARAYKGKKDLYNANIWLYRAIAEAHYLREPYVEMARLAYIEKNWHKCYFMVNECLKITERSNSYINEAFCWDYTIYDLGAICCYNLGLMKESLDYARKAVELAPDNERLVKNLELIEKAEKK